VNCFSEFDTYDDFDVYYDSDRPTNCERCDRRIDDPRSGMRCSYCREELDHADDTSAPDIPIPPCRAVVMMAGTTAGEMFNTLRAHEAQCVHCASTRHTVVSERLALNTPTAVCCESGKAA
jgi:hypothetical protein